MGDKNKQGTGERPARPKSAKTTPIEVTDGGKEGIAADLYNDKGGDVRTHHFGPH